MEAVGRLSGILDTLAARGFDTRPLAVDSPASPSLVDATEDQLGRKLPTSLRNILTTVASRAEFAWFAPTGHTFPNAFRDVVSGNLRWSLNDLPDLMTAVRQWVENVFPDPDAAVGGPGDAVLAHALQFVVDDRLWYAVGGQDGGDLPGDPAVA